MPASPPPPPPTPTPTPTPDPTEPDWIDRLTALAGRLGMNEVRVRWRLMAWAEWARGLKPGTEASASHLAYEHKICPECGRINDKQYDTCTGCGEPLLSRTRELLSRLGLIAPRGGLVPGLLGAAILLVFGRLAWEAPGTWTAGFPLPLLIAHGAVEATRLAAGETWRLVAACFLHAGLAHLAFNLVALAQVGPPVEEAFGRGRTLFLALLAGIGANALSAQSHPLGAGVGLSGVLMGMIGAAAVHGHRDGTRTGRALRDQMLPWAAYTLVLGHFLGADDVAHAAGFGLGALLALVLDPGPRAPRVETPLDRVLGVFGLAAFLVGTAMALGIR